MISYQLENKCGSLCKYLKRLFEGQQIYIFTLLTKGGLLWGISYGGQPHYYPQQCGDTLV